MSTQPAPPHADYSLTVQVQLEGITALLQIYASSMNEIRKALRALQAGSLLVHPEDTRQPVESSTADDDTPPICPVHNRPMKASRKPGAWFCTAKVDDGYCDQKVG